MKTLSQRLITIFAAGLMAFMASACTGEPSSTSGTVSPSRITSSPSGTAGQTPSTSTTTSPSATSTNTPTVPPTSPSPIPTIPGVAPAPSQGQKLTVAALNIGSYGFVSRKAFVLDGLKRVWVRSNAVVMSNYHTDYGSGGVLDDVQIERTEAGFRVWLAALATVLPTGKVDEVGYVYVVDVRSQAGPAVP